MCFLCRHPGLVSGFSACLAAVPSGSLMIYPVNLILFYLFYQYINFVLCSQLPTLVFLAFLNWNYKSMFKFSRISSCLCYFASHVCYIVMYLFWSILDVFSLKFILSKFLLRRHILVLRYIAIGHSVGLSE